MKINGYEIREKLYYTKEHIWMKIEEEKCKIGVTDYFQKMLRGWAFREPTDIVFVELPQKGTKFSKSESIASIESLKAVSDLNVPASGEVLEINEGLGDNPNLIGESPYEDGWIIEMKPYDLDSEIKYLLKARDYRKHLEKLIEKREQKYSEMTKEVGLEEKSGKTMNTVMIEVIGKEPPCQRCAAMKKNLEDATSKLKTEGIIVTIKKLDIASKETISKYGVILSPALAVNSKGRIQA
ncbi:unnamed protein product, partial [marine sediment metagenome]